MPDWLSYDHVPPGADLEEAEAERALIDIFGDGEAVLMELQDGTQLVFRGEELRAKIAPGQAAEAA